MDHIAIMKKSWGLIPKILSGDKTIESRWYQTRRAPWNKIKTGDKVFFKNSGEAIVAQATVSKVRQFSIGNVKDMRKIIGAYGKEICLVNSNPAQWNRLPRYCILVGLKNPKMVNKPFHINKSGFGISAAWITISDINKIKNGGTQSLPKNHQTTGR